MSPKKKVKEAEAPQQVQPESQPQVFKIPKKPFYRSVHLNSEEQVKHIQVKLWKINSFQENYSQSGLEKTISQLSKKQRVFKNLRRFAYFFYSLNRTRKGFNQSISKSWRLERFRLSLIDDQHVWIIKYIISRLNPHLKDFFLRMNPSQKSIKKLINGWEYLVDCNIWLKDYKSPVFALNTKKIRSLGRFLKKSNKNQVIESVEMVSQNIRSKEGSFFFSSQDIFNLSLIDASQLPNLKTLRVNCSPGNSMEQPLDFIKNYPQITTLVILADGKDAHSFEFLSSLPNLKQFTLHSRGWKDRISKTLPLIHSLEKLIISCAPDEFSPENLQEFFASNKNLKSLEVDFPLQDNYLIFPENFNLPLETLKLEITNRKNDPIIAKKLAAFFTKNQHLRSLEMYLYPDTPLDCSEILQKGIASMTCLENLIWHGILPSQLLDIQLKDFKKIFLKNPGIQKLELDFGGGLLMSRSSSSFIDGLFSLKKLKYFALRVSFFKISPATLGKFLQFIRFLVFENFATVKLDLQGFPEEITEEINALLTKKYHLFCDKNERERVNSIGTPAPPKW